MKLWHTLRRETRGAWRSVRYDLDSARAAKLAGAFTEEFEPSKRSDRSRAVPLTGVALLLTGGAAGAFLAISGGISALSADGPTLATEQPAAVGSRSSAPLRPEVSATPTARPVTPRRPGTHSPATPSAPAVIMSTGPVLEGSTLPSPSPTSASPEPSISADPSAPSSASPDESGSRPPDTTR